MEKKSVKKEIGNLFSEFKDFAFKEATLGVAIGIMLGGAVKSVIDSLVNDILTPPIAKITSGIDFGDLYVVLGKGEYESLEAAREAGEVVITYGNFISAFISFLITASVLFFIVYQGNKLVKKNEKKVQRNTKVCPYCKSEIDKDASRCPFCTSVVK